MPGYVETASDEFANTTQPFADWKDIMENFHGSSNLATPVICLSRIRGSHSMRQKRLNQV